MTADPTVEPNPDRCALPRSDLYKAPVPFQGRSLEGAPSGDDSTELARSLDTAIPVDDLLPVAPGPNEPHVNPIVVFDPAVDARDETDELRERRAAYARSSTIPHTRKGDDGRDRAGIRTQARARMAANDHWAALATENRDRKPSCGTVSGRPSNEWINRPFSCRERILDTLSEGESLGRAWAATLESGVEDRGATCRRLPSDQYGAMMHMIAELDGRRRHPRRNPNRLRDRRLLQLVEILDLVVVVV